MPRPLAKMSDGEFLAMLRHTRGKGKPLAEVFGDEAKRIESRCIVLTLSNVLRMLEAPIHANEWWAPKRIHAYVDRTLVQRFKHLTDAREDIDGRLIVETSFVTGSHRYLAFTPSDIAGMPFVWWGVEHVKPASGTLGEARMEHEALGLYFTSTEPRSIDTWNTHAIDHLVWKAHSKVAWGRGPIDRSETIDADGEPRAAIPVHVLTEVTSRIEQPARMEQRTTFEVQSPWGRITSEKRVDIEEIAARVRSLGEFAIEVPIVFSSLR